MSSAGLGNLLLLCLERSKVDREGKILTATVVG